MLSRGLSESNERNPQAKHKEENNKNMSPF